MATKIRSPQRPVTVPLSPMVLHQIGGLRSLPAPDPAFDPAGAWTQSYRIWTCYGYTSGSNRDVGGLRIERSPGRLVVRQTMLNADNVRSTTRAQVRCRADVLASPASWTLKSAFTDTKGKPAPDLDFEEQVTVDGSALRVRSAGRSFSRPGAERLTSDWSLFEAVQRLPFEEAAPLRFDMLEGLSLLKRGHRISYIGVETATLGTASHRLHRFHQFGRGILPYEYWLDEQHRLLVVVTGPRAYVFDAKGGAQ